MIFYTVIFLLTSFLFFLISRIKNNICKKLLVIIAILIPASVAGLRDVTIGTDTTFYAVEIFEDAITTNTLSEYLEITTRGEAGYAIINWIVASFTKEINWLLFTVNLLMWYFLVKAINVSNNWRLAASIVFLFMCYFYNNSMNLIRQMLATTCFLYGYLCYTQNKYKTSLCVFIIDFFLHKTSLFAIGFLFLSNVISKIQNTKKWIFVCVGFTILYLFLYKLNDLLSLISMVSTFSNYQFYTTEYQEAGSNTTEILVRIVLLLFIVYSKNQNKLTRQECDIYTMFLLFEIFLFFSSTLSRYVYRMAFYLTILEIIYIPTIISRYKNRSTRHFFQLIIYSLIYIEWLWLHVKHGIGATVPYTSKLLGIS